MYCKINEHKIKQLIFYGKCAKISYTKVSDKMAYANSADPDQTAPEILNILQTFAQNLYFILNTGLFF